MIDRHESNGDPPANASSDLLRGHMDQPSIDWFFSEKLQEHPMIFMGKSGNGFRGQDFPFFVNPLKPEFHGSFEYSTDRQSKIQGGKSAS